VEKLLEFCYTKKYTLKQNDKNFCQQHAQLYTLGDKYGITDLPSIAKQKFRHALGEAIQALSISATAEPTKATKISDILAAITHVYQNTREKDHIRSIVARIPWQSAVLRAHAVVWTNFVRQTPEYALDMSIYSVDKIGKYEEYVEQYTEYNCPTCGYVWSMTHIIVGGKKFRCPDCRKEFDGEVWNGDDEGDKPGSRELDMYHCHSDS